DVWSSDLARHASSSHLALATSVSQRFARSRSNTPTALGSQVRPRSALLRLWGGDDDDAKALGRVRVHLPDASGRGARFNGEAPGRPRELLRGEGRGARALAGHWAGRARPGRG